MNRLTLIIAIPLLLAMTACTAYKPGQRASKFYTPDHWKQPMDVHSKPGSAEDANFNPSFAAQPPPHRQSGAQAFDNSPALDDNPTGLAIPQEKDEIFTPRFGGASQEEQMVGYASWYGPGFHGKQTANGERYDQQGMTAAHKILPMNTWVRVSNQENGQSIVVRINDRGPYKKDRVLDLTKKGAKKLGFFDQGTAPVKLEVLKYPKGYDPAKGLEPYKQVVVQVAVFSQSNRAERLREELRDRYQGIEFIVDKPREGTYHVVAGPYDERRRAQEISQELKGKGMRGLVRSYRK